MNDSNKNNPNVLLINVLHLSPRHNWRIPSAPLPHGIKVVKKIKFISKQRILNELTFVPQNIKIKNQVTKHNDIRKSNVFKITKYLLTSIFNKRAGVFYPPPTYFTSVYATVVYVYCFFYFFLLRVHRLLSCSRVVLRTVTILRTLVVCAAAITHTIRQPSNLREVSF